MPKVILICPSCKEKGSLQVSAEAIKNVTRGLLAVNVAQNTYLYTYIYCLY